MSDSYQKDPEAYHRFHLRHGFYPSDGTIDFADPAAAAESDPYRVRCSDCGSDCGITDCEITATSPALCAGCHDADIARHNEENRR